MKASQQPKMTCMLVEQAIMLKDSPMVRVRLTDGPHDEVCKLPDGRKEIALKFDGKKMNRRKMITFIRHIVRTAKVHHVTELTFSLSEIRDRLEPGLDIKHLAQLVAENCVMANYEYVACKSEPVKGVTFINTLYVEGHKGLDGEGFERGLAIGKGVNLSRELANTPACDKVPHAIADVVRAKVWETRLLNLTCTVLGVDEMRTLGMGGVLAVGQGSVNEPRFIVIEYKGGKPGEKPIVVVGKTITFDSGGISIKPSEGMEDMKFDMHGGASAFAAIITAARLGIPKNIIVIMPVAENMCSGSAYRPSDVITTMSGKTIEVLNTDAEGRNVLVEGLTYAERYDPRLVLSIATLTGAACVALGQRCSALLTPDDDLRTELLAFGEESGDYLWPLPMWEEYDEDVKSKIADFRNTGTTGRYGGSITAAKLLERFAEKYLWAHIDMAPRMKTVASDNLAEGATGEHVRLLVALFERF